MPPLLKISHDVLPPTVVGREAGYAGAPGDFATFLVARGGIGACGGDARAPACGFAFLVGGEGGFGGWCCGFVGGWLRLFAAGERHGCGGGGFGCGE